MRFLDNPTLTGEVVEASIDTLIPVEKLAWADGEMSRRACTVYDPFKAIHGRVSGLQNSKVRQDPSRELLSLHSLER